MSFADSFWTPDYIQGFQTLFTQLNEGVQENEDYIKLFSKRMELEQLYGSSLQALASDTNLKPTSKRYFNDDYVSTIKNSYGELKENFAKQGQYHLNVAETIDVTVLQPFEKWSGEHEERVAYSVSTVNDEYKKLKAQQFQVEKIQKKYFNKCRMVEEFKSQYLEQELQEELNDVAFQKKISENNASNGGAEEQEQKQKEPLYEFAHAEIDHQKIEQLLRAMLNSVPRVSHKVAILGTYHNVSTGSAITQWALDNVAELDKNLEKAEKFGQDLIKNEFIRIVGSMGKSFINSSQFYYQWKPKAFEVAKVSSSVENEASGNNNNKSFSSFGQFNLDDMKDAIGVGGVDYKDISQYPKLVKDVELLNNQYYEKVAELDVTRCKFEELVMDHLTFMQKCELDRLRAIKKVTFDFIASFKYKHNHLQTVFRDLDLIEETINPINDLKFLVENYATGHFRPQVTLYDNYYESNIKQTFGVDLNVKSRLDKKVVPILIQCILSHLDNIYPDLKDDEERINIWTQPIHLSEVHKLRILLNGVDDPVQINKILMQTPPIVVTNVLKLYFMELPDSIIPSNFYDVIKLVYINNQDDSQRDSRINGLQNVLAETFKSNLATLDALLTHLKRLIQIIGSKDKTAAKNLQGGLCNEFGKLVIRPRPATDLFPDSNHRQNMNDKHAVMIMQDLFRYKDQIFNELKRKSSKAKRNGSSSSSSSSSSILHRASSGSSSASASVSREASATSSRQRTATGDLASTTSVHAHQPLTPGENLAAKSKSRLESRLKNAVKQRELASKPLESKDDGDVDHNNNNNDNDNDDVEKKPRKEEEEEEQKQEVKKKKEDNKKDKPLPDPTYVEAPSTPPQPASSMSTPSKSPISLKRSTSPKKKRLSSMLLDEMGN